MIDCQLMQTIRLLIGHLGSELSDDAGDGIHRDEGTSCKDQKRDTGKVSVSFTFSRL